MSSHDDQKNPIAIPLADLKPLASTVAQELSAAGESVPPHLREAFINVRAALFQRGLYDPVLVRFDSATAPKATAAEVGQQLAAVAEGL